MLKAKLNLPDAYHPIICIQCYLGIKDGSYLNLQTSVMIDPEPSAATLGEQSFAPCFGCSVEAHFLRPSGWAVWVRHSVMAVR